MKRVYFADWNCLCKFGHEIGRTSQGVTKVAIDLGHSIEVIEKDRVFESEVECYRFILSELQKQQRTLTERVTTVVAKVCELPLEREAAQ